ncbi:hypothetical protein PS2_130 [Serratia phage PS2]|uniref:Uncharacterized protein n=1 Tax=Serratia phage PS2 TaxID=1481112 RepID=A0A023W6C4_9CAUD|nr:hypothetical protein FF83_gp130 [Serratia phage PS2]AHY25376.1 hypothetical protein PS2_130 [Serratia phage PS2]
MKWSRNMKFCIGWVVMSLSLLALSIIFMYCFFAHVNSEESVSGALYLFGSAISIIFFGVTAFYIPRSISEFIGEFKSNKRKVKNIRGDFIQYCKDKY